MKCTILQKYSKVLWYKGQISKRPLKLLKNKHNYKGLNNKTIHYHQLKNTTQEKGYLNKNKSKKQAKNDKTNKQVKETPLYIKVITGYITYIWCTV